MRFQMDPNWERNLQAAVAPAMAQINERVNQVLESADGKSVDDVTRELVEVMRAAAVEPNEAELRSIAEKRLAGGDGS